MYIYIYIMYMYVYTYIYIYILHTYYICIYNIYIRWIVYDCVILSSVGRSRPGRRSSWNSPVVSLCRTGSTWVVYLRTLFHRYVIHIPYILFHTYYIYIMNFNEYIYIYMIIFEYVWICHKYPIKTWISLKEPKQNNDHRFPVSSGLSHCDSWENRWEISWMLLCLITRRG